MRVTMHRSRLPKWPQGTASPEYSERKQAHLPRGWMMAISIATTKLGRIAAATIFLTALQIAVRPPMAVNRLQSQPRGYSLPLIDLAAETGRQVVVDREAGQYLGHPSTVLLEDGRTILVVYTEGARARPNRAEAQF